jgi:hypothetical protein
VVGAFTIDLTPAVAASANTSASEAYTAISGKVSTGPTPQAVVWEQRDQQGDCVLRVPRIPFCDPACTGGAVCVEDNTCADYPPGLNAGQVTLTGVATQAGDHSITLNPIGTSKTYQPIGVMLQYPPFAEGDAVSLQATGSDTAPFSIDGVGIAPLEVITADGVPFDRDQKVTLQWVAGAATIDSRIVVAVDISHHGGQTGEIDCDTSDSGSLDIAAALVTQLLDLNYAGFPRLTIARVATTGTTIAQGRVELRISSAHTLAIEIAGLTSCAQVGDATECPMGQVCLANNRCG